MGRRIYPLNRIKYWYCYDAEEVCSLYKTYGLNIQTVRAWIKQGLQTVDNSKPALIYGQDLKRFLGKRNTEHKQATAFEEFFCMKCKEAKPALKRRISLEQTHQCVRAKARCRRCKTIMNKSYKMVVIPRLRSFFEVVDVLELYDSTTPTLNTHIPHHTKTGQNEPAQRELF